MKKGKFLGYRVWVDVEMYRTRTIAWLSSVASGVNVRVEEGRVFVTRDLPEMTPDSGVGCGL